MALVDFFLFFERGGQKPKADSLKNPVFWIFSIFPVGLGILDFA